MKIRSKAFLKFQIAVAIVTAIVSFIAFLLLQCITGELRNIDSVDAVVVLFIVILFAVVSGFSWKVWNGKSAAAFCGYNILIFFRYWSDSLYCGLAFFVCVKHYIDMGSFTFLCISTSRKSFSLTYDRCYREIFCEQI